MQNKLFKWLLFSLVDILSLVENRVAEAMLII